MTSRVHSGLRTRRRAQRGQELVEFVILVTFFLIVFFTVLQVFFTGMEKLQMNHYALYAARVYSTCPCTIGGSNCNHTSTNLCVDIQMNEALARVKLSAYLKRQATGRNLTEGDWWRMKYLWAMNSRRLLTTSLVGMGERPLWAKKSGSYNNPLPEGPTFLMPIPVRMPYASIVMGGNMNVNLNSFVPSSVTTILNVFGFSLPNLTFPLPKVGGFEIIPAQTMIPMDKEPSEDPSKFDNDRSVSWTDIF